MNPEKWKSVVVPIESYLVLKDMAEKERRTISGQFTLILEKVTGNSIAVSKAPNHGPRRKDLHNDDRCSCNRRFLCCSPNRIGYVVRWVSGPLVVLKGRRGTFTLHHLVQ